MQTSILVIRGSTRQGRRGERVGSWLMSRLQPRPGVDFELADLRDYRLPLFDSTEPPMRGKYAPAAQAWAEKVGAADGYIIVTPEYNHGYPGVLKNGLDHIYHEWFHKPVAFVSYGAASGGSRAVEQLRSVCVELRMVPIREQVLLPFVWSAFNDAGELQVPGVDGILTEMTDELLWWTNALKRAREEMAS